MALIATTNPFLTPLEFTTRTADEQEQIDKLIDAASSFLEKKLNRTFASTVYAPELHDGINDPFILVKHPPIITLISIVLFGFTSAGDETVLATHFQFKKESGIIRWRTHNVPSLSSRVLQGIFPRGWQNIGINYTGGYASIPVDIEKLVADLVIESFDPDELPGSIGAEKIGNYWYKRIEQNARIILFKNHQIMELYTRHFV